MLYNLAKRLNVIYRSVGLVGSAEDKLNQKKTMLGCFRVNLGINLLKQVRDFNCDILKENVIRFSLVAPDFISVSPAEESLLCKRNV